MKRTCLLLPCLLLNTALLLPCQVWNEAGDAGELPGSAQVPAGSSNLTQINGTLGVDDVDMYLIEIFDTTTFQASTIGGPVFDTELYLFDQEGKGVVMNDDSPGGGVQSRITGQFVVAPGRYYLAVTKHGRIPTGYANPGYPLWNYNPPNNVEREPNEHGRMFELLSWSGSSLSAGGAYTISLTGAAFAPPQLLLPGNHHLSEAANQTTGSTNYFSSTASGHYQVIFNASHFLDAGVNGPITLTRIQMRAEEAVQNPGGQVYQNVSVRVGSTSLNASTMSSTFATNLSVVTTGMGPLALILAKTIKRALGLCPNNYVVDIDLQAIGAVFTYDPLGPRPNLILDVSWTSAGPGPTGSNTVPLQDTTGGPAVVGGRGLYVPSSTAPTGTLAEPPVVNVEFLGVGGDDTLVPARVESAGASCGGSASGFYQLFPHNERFDLAKEGGLTLTPNTYPNPSYYTVTSGSPPVDLTKINPTPSLVLENTTVSHNLASPFSYPGGSTSTIRVSDNGVVYLDNAALPFAEYIPSLPKWLGTSGEGARFAACWHDWACGRNTTTHPNSGLHVRTDTNGDCYCTWLNVGRANTLAAPGGQSVNTFQQVIKAGTGVLELRYGNMSEIWGGSLGGSVTAITGYTRGRIGLVPSVDPGSRDLSRELPFTTGLEGANGRLRLTAVNVVPPVPSNMPGRMFPGQSIKWNVSGVPAGTLFGVQLLDTDYNRPGLPLPGLAPPGCTLGTGLNPVFWEVFVLPGANVTGTVPFSVPPGFAGTDLFAQFFTFYPPGTYILPEMSNTLHHTVGYQ